MTAADAARALRDQFPDAVLATTEFRGEHTVQLAATALHEVCAHCRDSLGFDYPDRHLQR